MNATPLGPRERRIFHASVKAAGLPAWVAVAVKAIEKWLPMILALLAQSRVAATLGPDDPIPPDIDGPVRAGLEAAFVDEALDDDATPDA